TRRLLENMARYVEQHSPRRQRNQSLHVAACAKEVSPQVACLKQKNRHGQDPGFIPPCNFRYVSIQSSEPPPRISLFNGRLNYPWAAAEASAAIAFCSSS